ncbi:MAG: hypothetical protein AAB263_16220 [Planctomycetota bacterium]
MILNLLQIPQDAAPAFGNAGHTQMKRGTEFTEPALLAGMWVLLAMLDALQQHDVADLKQLAAFALAGSPNST